MRLTKEVTITPDVAPSIEGRDNGKKFLITEMSAYAAEQWARRATLAILPRISKEVPEDVAMQLQENPNMPNLGRIGLLIGGISFPETEALMDEIMECVQFIPPLASLGPRKLGLGGGEDIEEVSTIQYLRKEALAIHTDFTLPASLFNLIAEVSRVDIRNM